MKRLMSVIMLAALLGAGVLSTQAAAERRGGVMGFIAGCCFGVRSGSAYNDGKDLHWREWGLLIPLFNLYVLVVNGVDGANGVTTKDYATQYGASYY